MKGLKMKKLDDTVLHEHLRGLSYITPDGSEIPDPRPVEIPVGFERPESLQETIRRLVTDPQLRAELENTGAESFDEADDFEVDDGMPLSPHEDNFDPLHLLAREQEVNSGTVRARSKEELEAATETLQKFRKPKVAPIDAPGKSA